MSDYCHPATRPVAAKEHRCIACHATIPKGETHYHQSGFFDGKAFRNRYHDECWKSLEDSGDFEFMPGDFEPPKRLIENLERQPQ